MTIETTTDRVTYTGNGSNTNFSYAFLIPEAEDLILTVTTIADATTSVIASTAYTVTGIGVDTGGIVTYPLVGSPLSSAYNITVQRSLPLVQSTELVNQSGYYPDVVEDALDYAMMSIQQINGQLDQALAFPVGSIPDDTSVDALIAAILNGAANAAAAAASAAAAAASAAAITALMPLATANIGDLQVTTGKLANNAVTALKLATSAIGQSLGMLNGTLVSSVAASALTVAVKTLAGADPSASDPVYIMTRSATQATGDFTVATLTTASSIVLSSGSTIGTASAVPFTLWVVMFNDAGTLRLGLINCTTLASNVLTRYPLNEWQPSSSTAEGGAGAADSAGVFYTGTAVSTKAFTILGRLDFSSGEATAGTWATAADVVQLMRPGLKLPGDEVKVTRTLNNAFSSAGSTATPYDDTIPQVGEGNLVGTQAFTPTNKCNILVIEALLCLSNEAGAADGVLALFQDGAANSIAATPIRFGATTPFVCALIYQLVANSTSSISFTLRAGTNAGNSINLNGGAGARKLGGVGFSSFEVREIQV